MVDLMLDGIQTLKSRIRF